MNAKIITILGIVVVIGGLFLATSWQSTTEETDEANSQATTTPVENNDEGPYSSITRVTAKQFYENGEHTFVGEMTMPTPCDLLEVEAEVRESMPEQIHLNFSVVNTAEACTQVLTEQRFSVSATASEAATVTASLEGRDLEVNLLEPEPGETPDDFELFIKG